MMNNYSECISVDGNAPSSGEANNRMITRKKKITRKKTAAGCLLKVIFAAV